MIGVSSGLHVAVRSVISVITLRDHAVMAVAGRDLTKWLLFG